jgi:SRSO17 transposase
MQIPIVEVAPVVLQHAPAFRDLFENRRQYAHFENYLTGLMTLENKTLSNISRSVIRSADKTNLSRFFSESPWDAEEVNDRRVSYLVEQTANRRRSAARSCLIIDDTLCEHVGSLFEHIDRHYNHGEGTYPLAHNLVTSHFVSGGVRFPVMALLYRRYEEMTEWVSFVAKHFPDREIPTAKKARTAFHKEVDPTLLEDPNFLKLHKEFKTKLALAAELIADALKRNLPFKIVLFDGWYLSGDLVETLATNQLDWVSVIKKNRNLETASFTLRDAQKKKINLDGAHIKVEDLVPLIPTSAFHKETVNGRDYWVFAINVRVPDLGKVRLVISFDNPELTGTYAALVSNRADWSARQVLETYLQRWPIETFYQDGKGHLGLDEYRMRCAEAFQKHWCLVFTAYSFLHLDCLDATPVKDATKLLKTIGDACRNQSRALTERLLIQAHDFLRAGYSIRDVCSKLFAKLQPQWGTA